MTDRARPSYYRSRDGVVIHRATCRYRLWHRIFGIPWHMTRDMTDPQVASIVADTLYGIRFGKCCSPDTTP